MDSRILFLLGLAITVYGGEEGPRVVHASQTVSLTVERATDAAHVIADDGYHVALPEHAAAQAGHAVQQAGHAAEQAGHAVSKAGDAATKATHSVSHATHIVSQAGRAVSRAGHAVAHATHALTRAGFAALQAGHAALKARHAVAHARHAAAHAGHAVSDAEHTIALAKQGTIESSADARSDVHAFHEPFPSSEPARGVLATAAKAADVFAAVRNPTGLLAVGHDMVEDITINSPLSTLAIFKQPLRMDYVMAPIFAYGEPPVSTVYHAPHPAETVGHTAIAGIDTKFADVDARVNTIAGGNVHVDESSSGISVRNGLGLITGLGEGLGKSLKEGLLNRSGAETHVGIGVTVSKTAY
ncbi:uncharacterized protein LOC135398149 [Ornithodoros turicata]|uniref:uncharacterized protein LOC135398149 n=1 Tax=Ornithodoros turicata TaxID=34597 RepID=UPI003139737D